VIRAYTFLLRPTVYQAQALSEMLIDHCSLYNAALQERRDAYRHPSKTTVGYGDQCAQLNDIRAFDPGRQGRWSLSCQQATLRRLDKAMQAFFRRVKAGQAPGYRRLRGGSWFETVEFPKDADGCRWDSTPHDPVTRVRLRPAPRRRTRPGSPAPPGPGPRQDDQRQAEGARWYAVLACDDVPAQPLPATGAVTGIDVGVVHFLTTSEGDHLPNPRHGKRNLDALADAQRALKTFGKVRRDKRTAKHRRAVEKVARMHRKVALQRTDHAHKTALTLIRTYDVIAHEKLNIAGMVRAPQPKPDPGRGGAFLPNGAAAKAGLNKSILDAGWGCFLGILANKAESAGRVLIPVDARNTSRTCPHCGHVAGENRPTQQTFRCVECGYTANADRVGALNVAIRAGLVLPDVA
jgi:putative transposase